MQNNNFVINNATDAKNISIILCVIWLCNAQKKQNALVPQNFNPVVVLLLLTTYDNEKQPQEQQANTTDNMHQSEPQSNQQENQATNTGAENLHEHKTQADAEREMFEQKKYCMIPIGGTRKMPTFGISWFELSQNVVETMEKVEYNRQKSLKNAVNDVENQRYL